MNSKFNPDSLIKSVESASAFVFIVFGISIISR